MPESDTPEEVSVATTLIPWRKDDNRARYFGYLACGFNTEEALYMLGLNSSWLLEQRADAKFNATELKIPTIRKELSKEYIELDFFRNFRLVLEKDYQVLKKAIEAGRDGGLGVISSQEHQYLLKLRSAYTPQQLQILEQVMHGTGAGDFNFAKWIEENKNVIEISRTDRIVARGRLQDGSTEKDNTQSITSIQT